MNPRIQFHRVERRQSLHACLSADLGLDDGKIRELFELRAVYIDGKRMAGDQDLTEGRILRVHREPRRYSVPADPPSWIVRELADFIVVDKPAGIPVHPTLDNARENVIAALSKDRPLFVTHRLDIATSGLLILAKTAAAQSRLNSLFKNRLVEKIYEADVEGRCEAFGAITHWMEPGERAPRRVRAEVVEGGTECRLEILESRLTGDNTRLRLRLGTGRTHQIRAQMQALGHPVLNDVMYGAIRVAEGERIALRATRLAWPAIDDQPALEIESNKTNLLSR